MVSTTHTNHPDEYFPIYVHLGDSYVVPFGTQRGSFYSVTGYPTHWMDGYLDIDPRQSNYESTILNRAAGGTDVTIEFSVVENASNNFSFTADVCLEAGGAAKTVRVYMAEVLDHWPTSATYYRNCLMQGLSLGDVALTPGSCSQLSNTFTFNATSMGRQDDIIVVAWAQAPLSSAPANVHQVNPIGWPFLEVEFVFDPERPASGETVNFTSRTEGRAVDSLAWDFGDGGSSADPDPTHSFSAAGCYEVTLTATSGTVDVQATKGVPVDLTVPTADFSISDTTPDVNQAIDFTDLSTGDFDSWLWDFGDGNTSTQQNPTHTYLAQGDYDVTLTVTNGCDSDASTMSITVCETVAPVADFYHTPSGTVQVGQALFFYDASSTGVISWAWDFDDGTTSSAKNVYHPYSAPGSYDVSLTVSSGCLEDTYVETVNVCEIPTAAFSSSPTKPVRDEPVYFTDQSTGGAVAWQWDFGDGGSSTLQNPTHTYSVSGNYTVTLTVTEAMGCSGETTGLVRVFPAKVFNNGFESGDASAWSTTFP